ncbi:MAG: DMT family transporter [Pseudomonadota bacterium]
MRTAALESPSPLYARGVSLVLIAGCFWSIGGVVVRLMESASEWHILFFRSLALMLTLFTYLAIRNRGRLIDAFALAGPASILAGLFLGVAFANWIFAMTHTTIANALFVLSASPFMAAVIARVVLHEKVTTATWLCMTIACAGIGIMVVEGVAIGTLTGNLLALGAAFGFACFTVTLRSGKSVDMTPAVCFAGIWSAIIASFAIAFQQQPLSISTHDLFLCTLLGLVQVGFGLILFTIGSRHVPAGELTLLSLTEVVLGPIWVWIAVSESPSAYTLIGGAVVLGAIVLQACLGIFSTRRKA